MVYRREGCQFYYVKIKHKGRVIRKATRTTKLREARQFESAYKNRLALEEVGIKERPPVPALREFAEKEFLPSVEARFADKPKTLEHYRWGVRSLLAFPQIANAKLDEIRSNVIDKFVATKREAEQEVTTINRQLEVLRRMLRLAVEWGKVDKLLPRVKMVPGAKHRERVLSVDEEHRYLAAAAPLLKDVATVLIDCTLRPEECFRLRWDQVRDGALHILHGKTENARRVIPTTDRVSGIIDSRRGKIESPWVFPAPTKTGHIEKSSVKKQHARAIKDSKVDPWVLYTASHTCLTRWAAHMDPYTLSYLAGHSDFAMTRRYVHPQSHTVKDAMDRARKAAEKAVGTTRTIETAPG